MKLKFHKIKVNQAVIDLLEAKDHEYFTIVTEELLELVYNHLPDSDMQVAIIYGVDGDDVTPYDFLTNKKKRNVGRRIWKELMANSEIIGEVDIEQEEDEDDNTRKALSTLIFSLQMIWVMIGGNT